MKFSIPYDIYIYCSKCNEPLDVNTYHAADTQNYISIDIEPHTCEPKEATNG